MVYLGIEGVTYDVVDGKEVVRPDVLELLNTDRGAYDELYGADDAYWMFQDNVMQQKWRQKNEGPTAQLEEWGSLTLVRIESYSYEYNEDTGVGVEKKNILDVILI